MVIRKLNNNRRFIFESIFTSFAWIFIGYFIYILTSYFGFKETGDIYELTISNVKVILLFTVFFMSLAFTILYLWGRYNKKRFGSLKRRSFPESLKIEEIAAYYSLEHEKVKELQMKRYIER